MSYAGGGGPNDALIVMQQGHQAPARIVEMVREAQEGHRLRFRLTFIATWVAIIGVLAALFAFLGHFNIDFLIANAPFVLGAVPLVIGIAIASILLAIVFAVLGAL